MKVPPPAVIDSPITSSTGEGKGAEGDRKLAAIVALHRRQAHESPKDSDRHMDEFLVTLAHELRNPLAPIRSALELMRMTEGDDAIAREARDVIERQTHKLIRLVDDLLDSLRAGPPLELPTGQPEAPPERVRATPRRVLVADDNRDAANSLVSLLHFYGHDVNVAYDGERAVAMARECQPEFVFLDLGMPRLNGYEAAEQIRAQGRPVRLVALTGWGQEEARRRARAAGFDLHFVKPLDPVVLQRLLAEEVVGTPRPD